MKLHIDKDQLNELSDEGKERLGSWFCRDIAGKPGETWAAAYREKDLLLSIGQLIEYLDEHDSFIYHISDIEMISWYKDKGICNELWEATKKDLENDKD